MGRQLIDPLRHAGIGVAGEDRHRPLVVAGALDRVPGAGIARAVVDQVQLRIVGDPAPRRAAADLPLVAFPGGEALVLSDRLRSEEHTSELPSLMRKSYAVFCLNKKT